MGEIILQNGRYTFDNEFRFHQSFNSYYIKKEFECCVFHIVTNSEDIDYSILDKNENVITHIPNINRVIANEFWEGFIGRNAVPL